MTPQCDPMGSICPQGSLLQVLIDVPSKSTATQRYSSHHHTRLRRRQENISHGEWQLVRLYKWYVTRYPCHLSSTQTCTAILTLSIVASNPQDPYQAIKPTHQTRIRIDFRVPHTTIQHLRT
jgi:hypothetical protein